MTLLAKLLDRPVKYIMPPIDTKDLRTMLADRDSQYDKTVPVGLLEPVENAEVLQPEKPAAPSPRSRLSYSDVADGQRRQLRCVQNGVDWRWVA